MDVFCGDVNAATGVAMTSRSRDTLLTPFFRRACLVIVLSIGSDISIRMPSSRALFARNKGSDELDSNRSLLHVSSWVG